MRKTNKYIFTTYIENGFKDNCPASFTQTIITKKQFVDLLAQFNERKAAYDDFNMYCEDLDKCYKKKFVFTVGMTEFELINIECKDGYTF